MTDAAQKTLQELTEALLTMEPGLHAVPLHFWHASRGRDEGTGDDAKRDKWSIDVGGYMASVSIHVTGATPEECVAAAIRGVVERRSAWAAEAESSAISARAEADRLEALAQELLR